MKDKIRLKAIKHRIFSMEILKSNMSKIAEEIFQGKFLKFLPKIKS